MKWFSLAIIIDHTNNNNKLILINSYLPITIYEVYLFKFDDS